MSGLALECLALRSACSDMRWSWACWASAEMERNGLGLRAGVRHGLWVGDEAEPSRHLP